MRLALQEGGASVCRRDRVSERREAGGTGGGTSQYAWAVGVSYRYVGGERGSRPTYAVSVQQGKGGGGGGGGEDVHAGDGRTNQPTNQPEEGAVCTGGIFSTPGPVAGGGETGNLHAEYAQPRDQGGRLVSCDGWDYGRVRGARGLTVNSALGGT